jgi:virginiamycin B lyase
MPLMSLTLLEDANGGGAESRSGTACCLVVVAALAFAWPAPAAAQTIQEFSTLTANSFPQGITSGADGNVWFTENSANQIGRITPSGNIVEIAPASPLNQPTGITAGPDGALWFTELSGNKIGQITTFGVVSPFTVPTASASPFGITAGPDGALWFTETHADSIGRITTAGNFNEFPVPTSSAFPQGITSGPDGTLWFTEDSTNKIGQVTTSGSFNEFTIPTANSGPAFIAAGSDGALWFTESANQIGRITTAGKITEFPITTTFSNPVGITAGPDGALWFAELSGNKIGRITTSGAISEFPIPTSGGQPYGITAGANNALWFTESGVSKIGTFQTAVLTVGEQGTGGGQVTSNVPVAGGQINCSGSSNHCSLTFMTNLPITLTASAASNSTFTGWSGGGCSGTAPCTVTMTGNTTVTASFALIPSFTLSIAPTGGGSGTVTSNPSGINCGATCSASFQSGTQVTLTASAASGTTFAGWSGAGCSGVAPCTVTVTANTTVVPTFVQDMTTNIALVAAVLPLSRSVEVSGVPATAFATMINAGPSNASTCSIAPATSVPASFVFQTTDPTTNALTGTLNTPANIASGASQSFVIAFTPTAAFAPTNIAFTFACANASPAASILGVNTLNLSAATTPVPDVVALAASGDPGYVDIPGATGAGAFAVATVNLGAAAQITAGANTGTANLPVTFSLCQTNPSSGACLAPPTASVTTTIAANATPTFAIFVAGSASIPDMPGVNRVFVTFTDTNGALRGETSVAVRSH